MLKLRKIAVTGGIASGKSSVCQFFKELGAYAASADAIAHELLDPRTDLGQQLLRTFGSEIIQNGQISRGVLAEKAFKDPKVLKKLEALLHPEIFQKIKELYEAACKKGNYSSFVVEIPLLFEAGKEKEFDVIIAVLAEEKIAKERFGKSDYDLRMKRQQKPEEKGAKAHYTIYNNGSLDELRHQVTVINRAIQNH